MLRVHVGHGQHPKNLRQWFPGPEPDPFFEAAVMTAWYGTDWTSVVVEENGHAVRHAFAASPIGDTGLRDVEPIVGYTGPVATAAAPSDFIVEAVRRYSTLCREQGIIAELVRFNPILRNDCILEGISPDLVLSGSKPVVYLAVHKGEADSMAAYPRVTRNMIRTGLRRSSVSVLDKSPEHWAQFLMQYHESFQAGDRGPEWQLTGPRAERLRRSPQFLLFGALQQRTLIASAVAIVHPTTSYYFLAAARRGVECRGASNAIVHQIARTAAVSNAARVGLGGGLSASAGDRLLRFKRSFGGELQPFRVGLFTHDAAAYTGLLRAAEKSSPAARTSPLFLRYRIAPEFAAGRMEPVPGRPSPLAPA